MIDRYVFNRVLAVHNGKGGTLKTSIAANLAGTIAASGARVLLVDLDPQANQGIQLGYDHAADDGEHLARAMREGRGLDHILEVRDNLHVAPGGSHLEDVVSANPWDLLLAPLDAVVDDFDLVILDTPPSSPVPVSAALGVAHHLLIPTAPDPMSLRGLSLVDQKVGRAREYNPYLNLVGVVLVNIAVNARVIRQEARDQLVEILGGSEMLLDATIRYSQKTAATANSRGQLVAELADDEAGKDLKFWEYLKRGERVPARLDAAPGLAADYALLAHELITRLNELDAEVQREEATQDQDQAAAQDEVVRV